MTRDAESDNHADSPVDAPGPDWGARARQCTAIPLTPPPAILAMAELRHREAVLEVWWTDVRLGTVVEVANYFLLAAKVGRRISDDDQRVIAGALDGEPWAGDVQRVLDHLAARPRRDRPARVPCPDEPFPWAEFWGVVAGVGRAVRRSVGALAEHGVHLPSVPAPDDEDGGAPYEIGYESEGDSFDPDRLTVSEPYTRQYWTLHDAVVGLRGRLETVPSRVVPPPVYADGVAPVFAPFPATPPQSPPPAPAPPLPRLWVDRTKHIIYLAGEPFPVPELVAAWVDVLAKANGRPVSMTDAGKTVPALANQRPHRLWQRLPEELQSIVISQPGAGSWVDLA
jgi:hypothetical protein